MAQVSRWEFERLQGASQAWEATGAYAGGEASSAGVWGDAGTEGETGVAGYPARSGAVSPMPSGSGAVGFNGYRSLRASGRVPGAGTEGLGQRGAPAGFEARGMGEVAPGMPAGAGERPGGSRKGASRQNVAGGMGAAARRPLGGVLAGSSGRGVSVSAGQAVAAGRIRGLAAAMRLSEVPLPVLLAIALLGVVAVVCGWLLHAQTARGVVVYPRDGAAVVEAASVDVGVTVTPGEVDAPGSDDGGGMASHDVGAASGGGAPDENQVGAGEGPASAPAMRVHVAGAVAAPGVYDLADGARVDDAIAVAGGLAADADVGPLNLAAPVADGAKVYVPREGEAGQEGGITEYVTYANESGAEVATTDGRVNVNTASLEQLCTLPGIGEATAQAIIDDREAYGPFDVPEDLMRVSGIGQKKFEKLATLVRCS